MRITLGVRATLCPRRRSSSRPRPHEESIPVITTSVHCSEACLRAHHRASARPSAPGPQQDPPRPPQPALGATYPASPSSAPLVIPPAAARRRRRGARDAAVASRRPGLCNEHIPTGPRRLEPLAMYRRHMARVPRDPHTIWPHLDHRAHPAAPTRVEVFVRLALVHLCTLHETSNLSCLPTLW